MEHREGDLKTKKETYQIGANSIETLQRSRSFTSVYADRTTRISVNGSEYSFGLPRSDSNYGIYIINDNRASDKTSQNAERNDPKIGGIFTCGHTTASFERYVQKTRNDFPSDSDFQSEGLNSKVAALAHRNVFCLFDYFEENQFENVRKHFLEKTLHFYDEETDTAVLELAQNQDRLPLSPPFQEFSLPDIEGKFTFLGHEGSAIEYHMVDLIIESTTELYECLPHNTLTNQHRLLFHCKFGKGASGRPGIAVHEDGRVVVVTMLLCGYPNWYYGQTVDRKLLQKWPKEYCIEQGTDMKFARIFSLQ